MNTYHKIQTVYKRDPETKFKTLLEGEFSLPEFEYLANNNWIWTEKIDGTNIRIIYNNDNFEFRGKTDKAQIPPELLKNLNEMFIPLQEKFSEQFPDGICLYGEGFGPKIQKGGGNYGDKQSFILFDIKIGNWWLEREDVESIAEDFGLQFVSVIGQGSLYDMIEKTREGFNSVFGNFLAEGIVARPEVELFSRNGRRIITKIKHKDF